jgi:flavin reductase (DIM6/NTAB) family NADH-FMN oxidoreductase RutF
MFEEVTASLFHYLLHPYPTFLVTCVGSDDRPNVLTVAWLIPASVDPPLVAMSLRATRHSYTLLSECGEFVVNVPPHGLAAAALHCGRRSGRSGDKFAATGLTPASARRVRPPIVAECLGYLECRTVSDVEAGDHRLLIGEVLEAYARPGFFDREGLRDVGRAGPLLHLGGNRFARLRSETISPPLGDAP